MSWERTAYAVSEFEFNPDGVVGKARPRFDPRTKRTYTVPASKAAEKELRDMFAAKCGTSFGGWDGEVVLTVFYQRPCPKSTAACRRGAPDLQRPDIDNVLKLVMDALNGVAWKDDSQITEARVRKLPRFPRTRPYMKVSVAYFSNTLRKD